MRHIEVGLIVGVLMLVVIGVLAFAWAGLNMFIGPTPATIGVVAVVVVTMAVIVIDWLTERKESK